MKHSSKVSITFTASEWCSIFLALGDAVETYKAQGRLPMTQKQMRECADKVADTLTKRGYFKNPVVNA